MPYKLRYIQRLLWAVVVTVTVVTAVSCGHRPTRAALDRAEALIDEHEDSALAILQTVDTTRLSGRRDHALYGLLMTQALVKLHQPVTSDSLIAPASRYFAASSDRPRAMRALYYHGVVKYDNEQYPAAMVLFFRARDIATDLDDHFWAGLACRGISDTYNQSYNAAEELLYARKEYAHFSQTDRQLYIRYASIDLARAYCSSQKYEYSRKILRNLIDTAISVKDEWLLYSTRQMIAQSYYSERNYEKALEWYKNVCSMADATADDSIYLALSYVGAGNLEMADKFANTPNADEKLNKFYDYKYNLAAQKWKEAVEARMICDSLTDIIYTTRTRQTLQSVVADDLVQTNRAVKSDLNNTKLILILSLIIGLCVTALLVVYFFNRLRLHKLQTEEKVILAEQLQEQLWKSYAEHRTSQNKLKNLLASKYTMLENLCRIVAESSMTKSYNQKIATLVTQIIKDITVDGNKKQELIDSANAIYDNIYDDFVRDLPNIKPIDSNLFLYTIHGFTNTEIMFLLNEDKPGVIYSRKRHLKNKIKQLPLEKADRYMTFFGLNSCEPE